MICVPVSGNLSVSTGSSSCCLVGLASVFVVFVGAGSIIVGVVLEVAVSVDVVPVLVAITAAGLVGAAKLAPLILRGILKLYIESTPVLI